MKIATLLRSPRFWEFVRYCMVGSSSTVIDFGVLALLTDVGTWEPLAANPVAFLLGVTNGYFWNRHWTFRGAKHEEAVGQYIRFVLVCLGGVLIDQAVLAIALAAGPALDLHRDMAKWLGKVAAIPFVLAWNFTTNSRWTFRRRGPRDPEARQPSSARGGAPEEG